MIEIKVMLACMFVSSVLVMSITTGVLSRVEGKIDDLRKMIIPKCKNQGKYYCKRCDGHDKNCSMYKAQMNENHKAKDWTLEYIKSGRGLPPVEFWNDN